MKTIVCLLDFSDATARLMQQTEAFAKAFAARVILLHIVPKEQVVVDLGIASPVIRKAPSPAKIQAEFERLASLGQTLAKAGIESTSEQLIDAKIETVLRKCEEAEAELIIVGSHQHSALYNWLIGSITTDVLRVARCPVLVVPADHSAP